MDKELNFDNDILQINPNILLDYKEKNFIKNLMLNFRDNYDVQNSNNDDKWFISNDLVEVQSTSSDYLIGKNKVFSVSNESKNFKYMIFKQGVIGCQKLVGPNENVIFGIWLQPENKLIIYEMN